MDRGARPAMVLRDRPQGIAGAHLDAAVGVDHRGRCSGGTAAGCGPWRIDWRCARCRPVWFSRDAGRGRGRRLSRRRRSGKGRQIQQRGVFAQQPSRRPTQLDQKIQIGFLDRLSGRNPDHRTLRIVETYLKTQLGQPEVAIDTGIFEVFRRCQTHHHLVLVEVADVQQIDLRDQALFHGRMQLQLAHAHCQRQLRK